MSSPKRLKDMAELPSAMRSDLSAAQEPLLYDSVQGMSAFAERLFELDPNLDADALPGGEGQPSSVEPSSLGTEALNESVRATATKLAQGSYWGWAATGIATSVIVGTAIFSQGVGAGEQAKPGEAAARPAGLQPNSHESAERGVIAAQRRELSSAETAIKPAPPELLVNVEDEIQGAEPSEALAGSPQKSATVSQTSPISSAPSVNRAAGLKEEAEELRQIRRGLSTDPIAVLAQINQSRFRQRGQLEPERRALEIEALVRLGRRGEAKRLAQAFLANFPGSPARVRIHCIAEPDAGDCD